LFVGIPENEELVNTYYSQYDDFSDSSESSDDEGKQTVIHRNSADGTLKTDFGSMDGDTIVGHSNDEDQFYNCLQDVLEQGGDAGKLGIKSF